MADTFFFDKENHRLNSSFSDVDSEFVATANIGSQAADSSPHICCTDSDSDE